MIGIKEYLQFVADDFCAYLDEMPKLCDLKEVNFDQGLLPNYSDIHVQQLYLLRYAYSYAFEYYIIYRRILLMSSRFKNSIKISSVGCGNGMDYWALAYALEEMGRGECSIDYRGNDKIKWNYRIEARANDRVNFIDKDIRKCMDSVGNFDSDVYIFPKSICEFDNKSIKAILKAFQNKKIENQEFYLVVSMRANEDNLRSDMIRADDIIRSIV